MAGRENPMRCSILAATAAVLALFADSAMADVSSVSQWLRLKSLHQG